MSYQYSPAAVKLQKLNTIIIAPTDLRSYLVKDSAGVPMSIALGNVSSAVALTGSIDVACAMTDFNVKSAAEKDTVSWLCQDEVVVSPPTYTIDDLEIKFQGVLTQVQTALAGDTSGVFTIIYRQGLLASVAFGASQIINLYFCTKKSIVPKAMDSNNDNWAGVTVALNVLGGTPPIPITST